MNNKQITSTRILIITAVIGGLAILGGLGYLGYQEWFGQKELTAEDYTKQSACEDAGYYWYENTCRKEKQVEENLVENCGTSSVSFSMGKPQGGYGPTLNCLGENILDNCSEAKATLDYPEAVYKVSVEKSEQCMLKLKYGEEDQLAGDQKQFANEYFECPIFKIYPKEEIQKYSSSGGEFAYEFLLSIFMMVIESPEHAIEEGCSGSLLQDRN